eukprot:gene12799-biopygen2780
MMINVVNNADIPVYEQFFKEFGMPDLRTVIRRSVANELSSAIDVALFNGQYPVSSDLPKLVDAYALNAAMMPDWTLKRLEEAGYIDRVNYRWVIADPPLDTTAEFFKEFGMPDLRTVIRRSVANELSSAIDVVVFNGHYPGASDLPKLVDSFALNAAMMPDWTFKMEDCQIRMRQGYQGSVIVLKTLMKGTRIFSVEPKTSNRGGHDSDSSVSAEILTSDSSLFSGGSSLTPNPFKQRSFKRLEEAGYIDRVNYRWVIADPPLDTTAEFWVPE